MASVDVNELLSHGRQNALSALRARIQEQADESQLGVAVLSVGLQDIHPPVEVGTAYELAVGSRARQEAIILEAEGYKNRVVPEAEAAYTVEVSQAEAYRYERAGTPQLAVRDLADWRRFCTKLSGERSASKPSPGKRIWDLLPSSAQQLVVRGAQGAGLSADGERKLIDALNELLARRDLWRESDLSGAGSPDELAPFLRRERKGLSDTDAQWLNRLVLEQCYPEEIAKSLDKIVARLEARRFEQLLTAYEKAPKVFRWRRRLMAMAEGLGPVRKYIVPSWAGVREVDVIDLQEKLQLDILNTDVDVQ